MNGILILFLLILISALPLVGTFIWFRRSLFPMPLPIFLLCLLSGALSVLLAALAQYLFPQILRGEGGFIFGIFIRVAATEEASRLITLALLYPLLRGRIQGTSPRRSGRGRQAFWAAAGLIAGFGFALIETASYGAANLPLALLRSFTAAPLHGACGARVGMALASFKERPGAALVRFITALVIHGMYNMMILRFSPWVPVLLAASALASSLVFIRDYGDSSELT